MEQDLNNKFTSTEPNSNIDIGLFDVTFRKKMDSPRCSERIRKKLEEVSVLHSENITIT